VPAFLSAALEGRPLRIFGDGEQSRDFTSVGTVVDVLRMAVKGRVVSEGPVNLAFGSRVSLLELAVLIEQLLGRKLGRDHVQPRPGDVRHSQADSGRLRSLFPEARAVELAEALAPTLEWLQQAGVRS
jgi:UDP-glucose 4-epimerase